MSFSANTQALNRYHAALTQMLRPSPLQCIVRDGMGHLLRNQQQFDCLVSADSPFLKEFFITVKEMDTSDDCCFSLLECLVIFFREKALRCGEHDLTPVEKSLLRYFESSGTWSFGDETLVTSWYWSRLPERCLM